MRGARDKRNSTADMEEDHATEKQQNPTRKTALPAVLEPGIEKLVGGPAGRRSAGETCEELELKPAHSFKECARLYPIR